MSESETVEHAETFFGDKLYQRRAREALPLLVRQAKAQKTIYYSDLAEELGMPNPRNLNYVLGSVGQTLIELGKEQGKEIPPLTCIVVNQTDGLPGEGVGFFIDKDEYKSMTKRQRRAVVDAQLGRIFAYPEWDFVLRAYSMEPATLNVADLVRKAAEIGRGGGESDEHKRFKEYIANHPDTVGLPATMTQADLEYRLPSGDEVDILFRRGDEWVGVEVKSHLSGDEDLVRGMFQCVKYQAVLEAYLLSIGNEGNVRTVLVIERPLPVGLIALRNTLRVEVIQAKAGDPSEDR